MDKKGIYKIFVKTYNFMIFKSINCKMLAMLKIDATESNQSPACLAII